MTKSEQIAAIAYQEICFCGISLDGTIGFCSDKWNALWADALEGANFFPFYGQFNHAHVALLKDRFLDPRVWEEKVELDGRHFKLRFRPQIKADGTTFFWCVCEEVYLPNVPKRSDFLNELADNLHEGVFRAGPNGDLLYANAALSRMFEYPSAAEMLSSKSWQLLIEDDAFHKFILAFRSDGHAENKEMLLRRKNGDVFTGLVSVKRHINDKGEKVYDGSVRDISHIKEIERQLKEEKIKAENASMVKQQFLSTISHELRTPLNAVIGFAYLLKEDSPRPGQVENVNALLFSAEALLSLINEILDFTKLDVGKVNLDSETFDLRNLIRKTENSFSIATGKKNLQFVVNIDEKVPKLVKGDAVRIIQILNNLLSNAVKFTFHGEVRLEVSLINEDEKNYAIRFMVSDTGIGIPRAKLDAVFSIFTQASELSTRQFGGTGLGLTITRKLVELHGSELVIDSKPGIGTAISFVLNMARSHSEQIFLGDEHSEQLERLDGISILAAEDNEVNQLLLRKFLVSWGAKVSIAVNGKEAVEMLAIEKYDVVLMDIQMPIMDGYTAAQHIRATEHFNKQIPIVAVTASIMSEVADQIKVSGMNDYLIKPYTPYSLRSAVLKNVEKKATP
ncbi:MAG: response regulator [Cryomorphaceae bacterium]|nr:response regulator [Cryomorphaceae bacterium]